MRLHHPAHPGRRVRLGYCFNVLPVEDADDVERAVRAVIVPLRRRFASVERFGVGLYLPARAAFELALPGASGRVENLARMLVGEGLEAFTFNAFPFGGFHRAGLKERVFDPPWHDPRRREFTLAVASIAERCARVAGWIAEPGAHVSISTHSGGIGVAGRLGAAEALGATAASLAELESATGVRVVLAVEPEPRSAANDTHEWLELAARIDDDGAAAAGEAGAFDEEEARTIVRRHVGLCLDACHAAVEFEEPAVAASSAHRAGRPLAKFQWSNALALRAPRARTGARERFLALAEPVFLHQVTARANDGALVRARDLDEVAAAVAAGRSDWLDADEWRCHFHVPVDLGGAIESGLGTTREHAHATLAAVLADPSAWGTPELHVEVETYTFDVLPREARTAAELVDAIEQETRHALAGLAAAGWTPAPGG